MVQRWRARDQELRAVVRYFQTLQDIMRLRILASQGEMTMMELARALSVSQALAPFHLRALRQLGPIFNALVGRCIAR
jgi:DNA-binding transcriptional ArsR family regulator